MKLGKWLLAVGMLLMLTSCKVNWGSVQYDVPWWVVAIPVGLILVISHILIVRRTYVCPECKGKIRLKWYDISAWFHFGNGRFMKCPHCGRKGFCHGAKHEEDDG